MEQQKWDLLYFIFLSGKRIYRKGNKKGAEYCVSVYLSKGKGEAARWSV